MKEYSNYLKKLSHSHHDNIPLDKNLFINFIIDILLHYQVITGSPT
ncbi:MAG: hypothetical protein GXP45_02025 [bacterium]|nr:hypothetical protein [bacterium]